MPPINVVMPFANLDAKKIDRIHALYLAGKQPAEIATIMELTESKVRQNKPRALKWKEKKKP